MIMKMWEIIRRKLTLIFIGRELTIAKKKISKRQKCNRRLIEILSNYLESYPDMRFGQALVNLKILKTRTDVDHFEIVDPFNEEPVDMLNRVIKCN